MVMTVGDPIKELDWRIKPRVPIVGDFRARKNGADFVLPEGFQAWLIVERRNGFEKRYDAAVSGNQILFFVPIEDSQVIEEGARFLTYLKYPSVNRPLLYTVGRGVRSGW
jgi:hypothetical protein